MFSHPQQQDGNTKKGKFAKRPNQPRLSPFAKFFNKDKRSLVSFNLREPKDMGTPDVIRYSFELPTNYTERVELIRSTPKYVDKNIGVYDVGTHRDLVIQGMRIWEQRINIKFVENNANPQVHIFKYALAPKADPVLGYANIKQIAKQTKLQIGFNGQYFNENELARILKTIIHELGHLIGLDHLFESLMNNYTEAELKKALHFYRNLTSYSIMNYNFENFTHGEIIIPITPLPTDMAAGQIIYGAPNYNSGDTIYHINEFTLPSKNYTIAALPHDSSGIDTFSAANCDDNVTLNLRPHTRSQIRNHFVVMPIINVENIICSNGHNTVALNQLDNVVNAVTSQSTIIYTTPHGGKDVILGFNPARDQIKFEKVSCATPKTWKMSSLGHGEAHIAGYTISYQFGAQIILDPSNTISLPGVYPHELTSQNFQIAFNHDGCQIRAANNALHIHSVALTQDNIYPLIEVSTKPKSSPSRCQITIVNERQLQEKSESQPTENFADYPQSFLSDFGYACVQGMATTFLVSLTKDILKNYGCTPKQIKFAMGVAFLLSTYASGSYLSSTAGFGVSSLLSFFNVREEYCVTAGIATSEIIDGLQKANPAFNIAAKITGGVTGCLFTMYSYRHYIQKKLRQNPILPIHSTTPVNNI